MRIPRTFVAAILAAVLVLGPAVPITHADPLLRPETTVAYNRYVQLTEKNIDTELQRGQPFLWVDMQPENDRAAYLAKMRGGQVVIERLQTTDGGKKIEAPGGLIHHWIGTVFIPGATLPQVLAVIQDYNNHATYYAPDVQRSKIISHSGNDYEIYLRLYKKKVISTVLDTWHSVQYHPIDATHEDSRSHTTKINEVENAGKSGERLLPPGDDHGYMWRMDTYWRFEQRDGGVYVECQSISLTRNIPTGLGWLVGPFVQSIPRESLTFTLEATRREVARRLASSNH